ncbi:MAG: lysozyme inhibitor LprI family protein [Rhizobiaceae bacterium]|nr:lysozyme inhibitor LprI family protein [Rhizobiaceae bacterium]
MFRTLFATSLILLPMVQAASAQSVAEMKACVDRSGGVSTEMLKCGKIEIDKWDKRLNAAYQTLMHHGSHAEHDRLRREQRVWLKHHLNETHRLAADPDNGSVAFIVSQDFELSDISQRTLELEKRVDQQR